MVKSAAAFTKNMQVGDYIDHIAVLAGTNNLTKPHRPTPNLNLSPLNSIPVSRTVHVVHVSFRYDDTRFNKKMSQLKSNLNTSIAHTHIKDSSINY